MMFCSPEYLRLLEPSNIRRASSSLKLEITRVFYHAPRYTLHVQPFSAWHTGHQNKFRPANPSIFFTVVPHTRHGCPFRRYT